MGRLVLTNLAVSVLADAIADTDTEITVATGDGDLFPTPEDGDWFPLVLSGVAGAVEIVHATDRDGDDITVERGREGTTPLTLAAGARVDLRLTAGAVDSKQEALAAGAAADANATITIADLYTIHVYALSSTNRTVTLPDPAAMPARALVGFVLASTTTAALTIQTHAAVATHRLAAPQDLVLLENTGSAWIPIARSIAPRRHYHTSSGTHTFTPGCRAFEIEVLGAGGGAGGTNQASGAGAGGGAGGYAKGFYPRPASLVSGTVIIGAAGAAGGIDGSSGGAGGASSWADGVRTLTGAGGGGGTGDTTGTSFKQPGAGGAGTGGLINITGGTGGWAAPGFSAGAACWNGGGGAPAAYGAADGGFVLNAGFTNGLAGKGFGAGGQGPNRSNPGVTGAGGAGAPGLVVVTEYF